MTTERCEWCGGSKHLSKACPTRRLVEYLTSDETVTPLKLPKIVITDEKHLVDVIEEAHALMHTKRKAEK